MSEFKDYNNGEKERSTECSDGKDNFWNKISSPYGESEVNGKKFVGNSDTDINDTEEGSASCIDGGKGETNTEEGSASCIDGGKGENGASSVDGESIDGGVNWNLDSGEYHGKPDVQDEFHVENKNDLSKQPEGESEAYNSFGSNETEKPPVIDENTGYNKDNIPDVKRGKVVFWPLFGIMLLVSVFVAIYIAKNYSGGSAGNNGSNALPSHEYTSDVIEHIETEPQREEMFEDKVALYNEVQKSCVTVICTVETTYFGQTTVSYSMGSGFVVSEDGYIVTNAHVVDGAKSYKVRFYDGKEYDALLVGKDGNCDLAVVKIRPDEKLYPASIGDSESIRVGDFAMAIGTPSNEELYGTMTFGVISGKGRRLDIENSNGQVARTLYMIQTDATLNPGNSGGPLFNMYGQVIGINTMKLIDNYEGMGFAIPTSGALPIINSLISTGKSDYNDSGYVKGGAQLGIEGKTANGEVKEDYNFSSSAPDGVLIVTIKKASAAYKAGVNVYDIITEFNGKKITDFEELSDSIKECSPGDSATMKVYREKAGSNSGEYLEYTFILDAVDE